MSNYYFQVPAEAHSIVPRAKPAAQPPLDDPVVITKPPKQPSFFRRHPLWFLVIIGLVLGMGSGGNGYVVLLAGCFLAAPVAYALWQTLKVQNAALDAAFRPIPSPAQIEYQLRQEGYNPSLGDVLAVRQYLERQRNQGAILAAGITLSALYVAHRADHLF